MTKRLIPLFPLQSIVLPGGLFPLRIFERRYLDMVRDCIKNNTDFCIALIRDNSKEEYITDVYNYGCLVKITDWNQLDDGLLGITVEGTNKVKIYDRNLEKNNLFLVDESNGKHSINLKPIHEASAYLSFLKLIHLMEL